VCAHFDPDELNWKRLGRESFEFNDLFTEVEGVFYSKDRFKVDSVVTTGSTFIYLMVFYATLVWYLDNVIPSNRGVPKPIFFPLMPSYWFPFLRSKSNSNLSLDLDSLKG